MTGQSLSYAIRLIRHAETDANRLRRVESVSDTPLNDLGHQQALALQRALQEPVGNIGIAPGFVAVYSSDICRAVQTCELAVPGCPVRQEPLLRERQVGQLAGRDYDEVKAAMAAAFTGADLQTVAKAHRNGIESTESVQNRLERFLQRINTDMCHEHLNKDYTLDESVESTVSAHRTIENKNCEPLGDDHWENENNFIYLGEAAVFTHAGIIHSLLTYLCREYGLSLEPPENLDQLPFCANTAHTRLIMLTHPQSGRLTRVKCDFLYKDDHLIGDLRPTHHLMADLSLRPRQSHSKAG